MQTRPIGSLNVSIVGLGCNNFGRRADYDASLKVIDAALDAGINFLDTADIYGGGESESFIGRALEGRRDQVIIATKFGHEVAGQGKGASAEYIRIAAEASLRRLNTDYIDLYQLHTPDPDVPIAETLGALNDLVQAGKVREIGCSNFTAEMLREAESAVMPGAARFVSVQNHYSMLTRGDEAAVLPECERLNIAYLPYFPLERGLLTGKFRLGQPIPDGTRLTGNIEFVTDEKLVYVEKLIAFANEHGGHNILELAFSWLLTRPQIASVIAGAMTHEQVFNNVEAANWQLSADDLAEIDELLA